MVNVIRLLAILVLQALSFSGFAQPPYLVSVDIFQSITPAERERDYERPLDQSLKEAGLGRVAGGKSSVIRASSKKEINYSKVYVELTNKEKGVPFLKKKLKDMHFPPGTWISHGSVSESVVMSEPARPQPMANAQTMQVVAVEPDQFKRICECTEQDGWFSLNRSNDQWQLTKLEMEKDGFSSFYVPKRKPDGTIYYFRMKELEAGSIPMPAISYVKDASQKGAPSVRFGLDPDFGKLFEIKENYFTEGENVELTFRRNKYRFLYKVRDSSYYIYLSGKSGLFQIAEGDFRDWPLNIISVTVDWVGDLNRDGRLDFILDGIENVSQLKELQAFLFLSTANNCYRIVQQISYEDYVIGKDQSLVPPPNPAHQFCVQK